MRLLKNSTYTLVSNVIGGLAFFLINVLVARYRGANDFGTYSFVFAFLSFFVVVANMGMDTVVVRELARKWNKRHVIVSAASAVKLAQSCLALSAAALAITALGYDPLIQHGVWLATLTLLTSALTNTWWAVFQARFEMAWYAVTHLLGRLLILGLTAAFLQAGHGVLWLILAHSIAGIAQLIGVFTLVTRRVSFTLPSMRVVKFLAWESLPLALSTLFISLYYRLDVLMLSFWRSQADIGYYAAVYTLTEAPAMIAVAWNASLYPLLSSLHTQKNKFLDWSSFSVKAMFLLALPLSLGAGILAPSLIRFVYGSGYDASIPVLRVLVWGGGIIMINVILSSMLNALGRQHVTTIATGGNLVLNGVLNLWAIPRYGIIGAAATTTLTELVCGLCMLGYLWRHGYHLGDWYWLRGALAAALMALVVLPFRHLPLLVVIGTGVASYIFLLHVTRAVTHHDFTHFRKVLRGA